METVLITGATSGIGLEFAKIFAKNNYNLVLVGRNEEKLEKLKNDIEADYSVTVDTIQRDLSVENSGDYVYERCEQKGLVVDILVNNAGFGDYGYFLETDWNKEKEMMHLNMLTLTELTKLFTKKMVEDDRKGKVLNVASTAAFLPGPLMSVYYATKAYVLSFSQAIANEFKDKGIKVSVLCPGPTESNFQNKADMRKSKLVTDRKLPTSYEVALYGYNSLMKGKVVAIHGFMNKVMMFIIRFLPRKLTVSLVRQMSEQK